MKKILIIKSKKKDDDQTHRVDAFYITVFEHDIILDYTFQVADIK